MTIREPCLRKIRHDTSGLPWWRRLLRIWERPIYELVDEPGFKATYIIEGKRITLFAPYGVRTDLASSPAFSWVFGFNPAGVLSAGALWHDLYYRNGFLLAPDGRRLYVGRGKAFADSLLAAITAQEEGLHTPGRLAQGVLAVFGWPAWWEHKHCRERVAADPDPDAYSLYGEYDD